MSYPAANLRFIKGEGRKKNPSAVSFNSAARRGEALRLNLLIVISGGERLSARHAVRDNGEET